MDDATVRLQPGPAPRRGDAGWRRNLRRNFLWAAAGCLAGGIALGAALWWGGTEPPPATAPPPAAVQAVPTPLVPLLSEAEILAHRAPAPMLLRLREHPRIFVLDFPDLESQGAALNRVAALVEKLGLPRDRVLTPTEMAAAIQAGSGTPATYYYGHDYRGGDLARFFALADRDGLALSPAEAWVREALAQARALVPEGEVALISVAAAGPMMDAPARQVILRHEIGHGRFFTEPGYAELALRVWRDLLTEAERAAFRRWLASEGYDAANEGLMANEAQAYLLHTQDRRFFHAGLVGMEDADIARLRGLFGPLAEPPRPAPEALPGR